MRSQLRPLSFSGQGLIALVAMLGLTGCNPRPITVDAPPPVITQVPQGDSAENMLDWAGTYQAVLPDRTISVQLRDDRTATVRERNKGSTGNQMDITYQGPFRFDPAGGSLITLSQTPQHQPTYRFFVGENWLELRERASAVPLPQPQRYRLQKTSLSAQ